jgi:hypothetical protein
MVCRETIEVIGGGIVEKRIWVGGDRLSPQSKANAPKLTKTYKMLLSNCFERFSKNYTRIFY